MNGLFDPELYPTPAPVIRRMLLPYAERLGTATVLEPSAGNGRILDLMTKEGVDYEHVSESGRTYPLTAKAKGERTYAIEKDPELRMILQQKGYRVIATDYLAFRPEHHFDLIIQNPPFSRGAEHLLHSWEILRGGDIVCLLNAETLRNTCTATRRRLSAIIKEHGSVEYLGQAFADAENPTDVEIALVRLHKDEKEDPFEINLKGFAREKAPDFGDLAQGGDQLAVNGQLDAYIRCWDLTKAAAADLIRSFARMRFFAESLLPEDERGTNVLTHILKTLSEVRYSSDSMAAVYNDFLDNAKASAWSAIFRQIGLGKYMTTGLQHKLDEFRHAQGALTISKENIMELFRFIMANIGTIMDQSII